MVAHREVDHMSNASSLRIYGVIVRSSIWTLLFLLMIYLVWFLTSCLSVVVCAISGGWFEISFLHIWSFGVFVHCPVLLIGAALLGTHVTLGSRLREMNLAQYMRTTK